MFRRRPLARRGLGVPDVPPRLRLANQLFANEKYAEAAEIYEELAGRFPGRSPFLFLQAGLSAVLAGQTAAGMTNIKKGLSMLASRGRYRKMQRLGQRTIDDLTEKGLKAEADEITNLLKSNGSMPDSIEEITPAKKPILPTHCPSCGGAVRPDEVEWVDDITAECAYCGSPVRSES